MKKIFYLYTIILIYLVLFKFNFSFETIKEYITTFRTNEYEYYNLIFFKTIKSQLSNLNIFSLVNLIFNTLAFMLFGILFQIAYKKKLFYKLLLSVVLIILVECTQLIYHIGIFDVDDIVLNVVCIYIGIFFVKVISYKK